MPVERREDSFQNAVLEVDTKPVQYIRYLEIILLVLDRSWSVTPLWMRFLDLFGDLVYRTQKVQTVLSIKQRMQTSMLPAVKRLNGHCSSLAVV